MLADSWQHKGRPLFLALLNHYSRNGNAIIYYKYDSLLYRETEDLKQLNIDLIVDCIAAGEDSISADDIAQKWTRNVDGNSPAVVAIDSISPLLLSTPAGTVCSAMKKVAKSRKLILDTQRSEVTIFKGLEYRKR